MEWLLRKAQRLCCPMVLLTGSLLASEPCIADAVTLPHVESSAVSSTGSGVTTNYFVSDSPIPGIRIIRNVPYGHDDLQRMDIYLPQQAAGAPVLFMVHGGAWRMGDKAYGPVVENKVAYWVPRGFIFISTNYRLSPKIGPIDQAQDIAIALATAQKLAPSWGGDPHKFILMGHSAGAHLVALLSADPNRAVAAGALPWLGAVFLDAGAYDITKIMNRKHAELFDQAFGTDPAYWKAASPYDQFSKNAYSFLAICSTPMVHSCEQANWIVAKAHSLAIKAAVLGEDLSHRNINQQLGVPGAYTLAVDQYMGSLDESIMRLLSRYSPKK